MNLFRILQNLSYSFKIGVYPKRIRLVYGMLQIYYASTLYFTLSLQDVKHMN